MCEVTALDAGLDGVFVENAENFLAEYLIGKRGYQRHTPPSDLTSEVQVSVVHIFQKKFNEK